MTLGVKGPVEWEKESKISWGDFMVSLLHVRTFPLGCDASCLGMVFRRRPEAYGLGGRNESAGQYGQDPLCPWENPDLLAKQHAQS